MSVRRFYVSPTQIAKDTIRIGESERHYLLNVLRLKAGDRVQVFDGEGNSFFAALCDTRASSLYASILQHQFHPPTPPYITLFQGLPKFDKMDVIVQKTTEIGVDGIVPMICQRSIPKRTETPQKNRQARWQKIANEAAKQCERSRFAKVTDAQQMDECLALTPTFNLSILFWENEERQGFKEVLRAHPEVESIGLFVGPEGGFSQRNHYCHL